MSEQMRMPELNKVIIAGRMTHDIELRFTPSSQAVSSFRIAVNKNYKDVQTGQWKELVSFIPVVVWGKLAERCGERLKKGNAVTVEGRLQSRSFESKTGEKRYVLEVIADRVQFLTKTEAAAQVINGKEDFAIQDQKSEGIDNVVTDTVIGDEEIPF